ncbi:MAG: alpha/beta hydrolase [Actinomycetota bacterium]|nr:alpha/beta hydrolase [Actinomycetota bacterium]
MGSDDQPRGDADAATEGCEHLLVLLHGLGGTGAVWDAVRHIHTGDSIAPDLAGHGGAERLSTYEWHRLADELVERIGPEIEDRPLVLCGHSLGGVVALEIARRHQHRLRIERVVAIGTKTTWAPDDVAALAEVADRGVAWFDDRIAAAMRHLRMGGLTGLVDPRSPTASSGVTTEDGRHRLAVDPAVYRMPARDVGEILRGIRVPVVLVRGERDELVPPDDLTRFGLEVVEIAGRGHNVHVEDPGALVALLEDPPPDEEPPEDDGDLHDGDLHDGDPDDRDPDDA